MGEAATASAMMEEGASAPTMMGKAMSTIESDDAAVLLVCTGESWAAAGERWWQWRVKKPPRYWCALKEFAPQQLQAYWSGSLQIRGGRSLLFQPGLGCWSKLMQACFGTTAAAGQPQQQRCEEMPAVLRG